MKHLIKKAAIATILFTSIASLEFSHSTEVNAKSYKTYISPTYNYFDGVLDNKGFFAGNYKKKLSNGLTIKSTNPDVGLAHLVISKNGKKIYANSELGVGLNDDLKFSVDASGYLNIVFASTDRDGNGGYHLISVSPQGKVFKPNRKNLRNGVSKLTFTKPNKLKITKWNGKSIIHSFNKGKIK